ncbi:uncharacterized protein EDB91DRAFT_1254249 [Suillus paluster]|uniref:uncharacterized protein n=1 Tax=Suillus paluster TaxID=48578 RepID=UPI001B86EB93|nr:uncharacterized protein EDB91DRAFT_1255778 [Suillus paluster]XP_041171431.1 uncharacterized protein EDB91DRAFT_1254249 [Suillus paluster]KAG1723068.1 hypothetical protein EDB91DRAFT_1255778 [Suillus paluster]KAG1726628.1 hypothetical protein EDB91DRAFT_1254249 [Suillus paluster]
MISRARRALISLVFTPWVSAAPAMQLSELSQVESLPAICNFDLSTIQHDLCTLVHDLAKVVEDEATLTSPYSNSIDLGEHLGKMSSTSLFLEDEKFPANAERLQTMSDTPIAGRRPSHDLTSDAGRLIVIDHNIRSPDVGGLVINFVFLPRTHTDELDFVHVSGCARRLTWESLHACDQELVESWKIVASDNGRPKRYELLQEEGLLGGKTKRKRNVDTDKNSTIFKNGESDASETDNEHSGDGRTGRNVDTGSDEGNENEGNDEKSGNSSPDENPTDEQDGEQKFIPPPDRNSWSPTTILLVTSSILIVATRLLYARLRGLVRSYLKPNRFRVGETMLLRWAHEDMAFDDEEEDTMVNGIVATGEEIPLKPSPRKNFVIQYGSAQ